MLSYSEKQIHNMIRQMSPEEINRHYQLYLKDRAYYKSIMDRIESCNIRFIELHGYGYNHWQARYKFDAANLTCKVLQEYMK